MATIKDVAKEAGTSVSTVSIILNGKEQERKISEQTVIKVRQAIKTLKYVPSTSAKKLRGTGRKTIVLFWAADFRDIMLAQFLSGVHQEILEEKLDLEVVVVPYQNGNLKEISFLERINEAQGVIFANASDADLEMLSHANLHIPLVLYNRHLDGFISVGLDDEQIADLALSLLEGKPSPILFTAPEGYSGLKIRSEKILEKLSDVQEISLLKNGPQAAYDACRTMDWSSIQTVYTLSDMMAIGILKYLKDQKIQVPEQVEVLSIGNGLNPFDAYLIPSLSTIEIPLFELAKKCLAVLYQMMIKKPAKSIDLSCSYIQRESFQKAESNK